MFLYILAHGKGYRDVTTIFNHSLQTVCHYVKEVLCAVVTLSMRLTLQSTNYNDGVEPHMPNLSNHPLFGDCIDAIDGMHVKVVLSRHERLNFMGRKGGLTQNVLAACDFNLCFTFMLAGYSDNTHDARILACDIHNLEIHFPLSASGKYYLVDSGFAHRPGCVETKMEDLGLEPRYPFPMQVAIVVATLGVHNFLRLAGLVDEEFTRAEVDEDAIEVELLDAEDEMHAEINAPKMQQSEWDRLRDYMAQQP
ncbi:uncharacterized protein LOC111412631 [Olea europaea var. sylvestris]|uniref:uncharacterized protein LOC111412631 n=1 Tax=Olea europaea var. sylvestris TaxID=158386 RepID=UPI000C1D3BA3|nr:uncharacterized protein LOC111412631 [Olea europaea var. sylvestris]